MLNMGISPAATRMSKTRPLVYTFVVSVSLYSFVKNTANVMKLGSVSSIQLDTKSLLLFQMSNRMNDFSETITFGDM